MAGYRFDEHGKGYKIGKALQSYRPQWIVMASLIKGGSKVLDLGCGDGIQGQRLIKEKGFEVFGIDLDPIAVTEAKRRGLKAKTGDISKRLNFSDKSFDYVICNVVLELVKKPDFLISEMLRVGKTVIIGFENFGFWIYRIEMLSGKFPQHALYGHKWYESNFTSFFSLSDFLSLPSLKKAKIKKVIGINWRNRKVSLLARLFPNLFSRSCILVIEN